VSETTTFPCYLLRNEKKSAILRQNIRHETSRLLFDSIEKLTKIWMATLGLSSDSLE